jgi:predicted ATPase
VPLTALIGREQEVQVICDLLSRPEVRLLTITGTGGVGKTRLSLEVAGFLHSDFTDGIWFVPLAPVSDPAHVLAAIAQALGLWEAAELPPEEPMRAALRDRHLLLLLDNFEQVVEGASQLTSLLASCPRLSMLVTSRAALHLSGEQELPVSPLAVPDLTQMPSPEILTQRASVRLFVLRTQAIQPAFHLTPTNARAIAEICVQLDGLPLAIELAAARIKLLPPQALLKRLSHRLEVFVGGWTLEAAEAVCQAGQAGGEQVLSVLEGNASLLDKSLVQQTEREGEEPRFVMLETLREFGLECLERQGELEAARRAHAHYYLALVEAAEPHLLDSQQLVWLDRLERELDNLRAILQMATTGREEEVELVLRLASALRFFWAGRGICAKGVTCWSDTWHAPWRSPPPSASRRSTLSERSCGSRATRAGLRRSPGAREGAGRSRADDPRHDPARSGDDVGQTRLCGSAGVPGGGPDRGSCTWGSPPPRPCAPELRPPGVVPARRSAGGCLVGGGPDPVQSHG